MQLLSKLREFMSGVFRLRTVKSIVWNLTKFFVVFSIVLFQNLPAAIAAEVRYVDIAQVTWNGAFNSKVSISEIAVAIESQVGPNWTSFTSLQGSSNTRSINFKVGETLLEPVNISTPFSCNNSSFVSYTNFIRSEVYRQLKIQSWQDRYLVLVIPESGCIWSGRATIGSMEKSGGVLVLHNTSSAFVISHELGHTLGLGHSNFLRCDSGNFDGPWSQSCKAVEYGGSIDVMGNVETSSPLSTYHQWRLGLLDSSEVKQSWLNESIELTASDVYGGTRAIFIRDGKSTYWIEYRRPRSGAPYNAGLVIFRTDPPSPSFIDSPNPEDGAGFEPGLALGTDIWMLNLDSYFYSSTGRATGSMTLRQGRSVVLHSGGITLEASAGTSDQKINVNITRKSDVTAPPIPPVTPTSTWRYPRTEIIESGYDDGESAIAGFDAQIDGKVVAIVSSINTDFVPTYLDPLNSRRTVYVKDLPEGTYSLAIRAIDVWGNKGAWSPTSTVTIDRGAPIVKNDAVVLGANRDFLQVSLSAIKDTGSNLCTTQIVNEDGFVLQSSSLKSAPEFILKKVADFKASLHT